MWPYYGHVQLRGQIMPLDHISTCLFRLATINLSSLEIILEMQKLEKGQNKRLVLSLSDHIGLHKLC